MFGGLPTSRKTSHLVMVVVVALVGIVMVGTAQAHNNNNNNGQQSDMADFGPTRELCERLCVRSDGSSSYRCPFSCQATILDSASKRATRGRRFDDFRLGFDDYLFMKLLGRDLGDKA